MSAMGFNPPEEGQPDKLEEQIQAMMGQKLTPQMLALINDERIYQCAMYHLSKGYTVKLTDEAAAQARFVDFKGTVMRGEMSVQELEDSVYKEFGVMDQPNAMGMPKLGGSTKVPMGFRKQ